MAFSHTRDDISSKQVSKKTDFTVDLIWWDLLRVTPIMISVKAKIEVGLDIT